MMGKTRTRKRLTRLATLSDRQIVRKGDHVVRLRHELAIELLDCLIEISRRSLYLKKGYSSLFDYCIRRWRFSPAKAGRFIAAARCTEKFPEVRVLLEERKIAVWGIAAIARLLTEENRDELLRTVSGKTHKEIERIVAARRSAPPIREFIRPIGTASQGPRTEAAGRREDLFNDERKNDGTQRGGDDHRAVGNSQYESAGPARAVGDSHRESEIRGGCTISGEAERKTGETNEGKSEERAA